MTEPETQKKEVPEVKQEIEFVSQEIAGQQALVVADREPGMLDMLLDSELMNQGWRAAQLLSNSTILPKDFVRQPANVFIALHLAKRLRMDPIMCMQKMYIVHGRPAFEAQFQIALVNASGLFTEPIRWKETGTKGSDDWGMIAYATRKSGGKPCEARVTIGMAKAEGWLSKEGSKWKSLPELMLCYRSASFFARIHCPEVILGMQSKQELEDTSPGPTIEIQAEPAPAAAPPEPVKTQTDQTLELLMSPASSRGKKPNGAVRA
jgi:hypothetical protein